MNIWVYIDGFNLYNGRLSGTPYKWLNPVAFAEQLLPKDSIDRVKYFSARVNARVNDPDQPLRQAAYWKALRTLPGVEIKPKHLLTCQLPQNVTDAVGNVIVSRPQTW